MKRLWHFEFWPVDSNWSSGSAGKMEGRGLRGGSGSGFWGGSGIFNESGFFWSDMDPYLWFLLCS